MNQKEVILTITKQEFIELYYTMNHVELMQKLGLKNNTFYKFVKQLKLKKKRGRTPMSIRFSNS